MKEFIVSLDIITPKLSRDEFCRTFGVKLSGFDSKEIVEGILWWVESELGETASLTEHINNILERYPLLFLPDQNQVSPNGVPFINVGVLHDAMTCTVEIPYECIKTLEKHRVGIKICCYPTATDTE